MFAADAVRCMRRSNGGGGGGSSTLTWSETDKETSIALSDSNTIATSTSYVTASVGADIAFAKDAGEWYVEMEPLSISDQRDAVGISLVGSDRSAYLGVPIGSVGYRPNGALYVEGAYLGYQGSGYSVGSVIGIAIDISTGQVSFYVDGISQALAEITTGGLYVPSYQTRDPGSGMRLISEIDSGYTPAGKTYWS